MRWKYLIDPLPEEEEMRNEIIEKIDVFWNEFKNNEQIFDTIFSNSEEKDLSNEDLETMRDFMRKYLNPIDPNIMWEFGPPLKKEGHRLVITPEGNYELKSLVEIILNRAPILENWEFYGNRLPLDFNEAALKVAGRMRANILDLYFTVDLSETNRIDIMFFSKDKYLSKNNQEDLGNIKVLMVAIEELCGELILDDWIGDIDYIIKKKPNKKAYHISILKEVVDASIKIIQESLPSKPYYNLEESKNWIVYEVEPKPEILENYPRKKDIIFGNIQNNLMKFITKNEPFNSKRFSNNNELFVYLKIDAKDLNMQEKFDERNRIGDNIEEILTSRNLGCIIGEAIGIRYYYIDLVLLDVEKSIKVIKEIFKQEKINKNAYLLFWDSHLINEWIGINDNATPPFN